jgi:hypothetical protein
LQICLFIYRKWSEHPPPPLIRCHIPHRCTPEQDPTGADENRQAEPGGEIIRPGAGAGAGPPPRAWAERDPPKIPKQIISGSAAEHEPEQKKTHKNKGYNLCNSLIYI